MKSPERKIYFFDNWLRPIIEINKKWLNQMILFNLKANMIILQ